MRYNSLGRTGLRVSEICLGTMTFGGQGNWEVIGAVGQEDANALLRTAVDAGVNFIDTADVYHRGLSEKITGQAIRDVGLSRDEIVVATKVFNPVGTGVNQGGLSRSHILNSCRNSLQRLQLDYIDLYQVHAFDPLTPIVETLEALDTLVRDGQVRYIGISNWAAWQIARAIGYTEARQLAPIATLQAFYTAADRDLERELVPMCLAEGVGLMVWSPLSGGLLSGKFDEDGATSDISARRANSPFPPCDMDRTKAVINAMRPIAARHEVTVAQVALAWLLQQPVTTSVIVGAKRAEQLEENIGAIRVQLSDEDMAAISKVSQPKPEYPGWMIEFTTAARLNGEVY